MNYLFKLGFYLTIILGPLEASSTTVFDPLSVNGYDFNARIRSPIQDESGFVWFSSKNSIWRFDGYQVTNINDLLNTENIDLNRSRFIYQDKTGVFWLGTQNGKLYTIKNSIENLVVEGSDSTEKPMNFSAITELNGTIWLATQNELLAINDSQISQHPYPAKYNNSIINSLVSKDDDIYIVTSTDMLLFSSKTKHFKPVQFETSKDAPDLRSLQLFDQKFWLATDHGVYIKSYGETQWRPFLPELLDMKIRTISVDSKYVWVATILNGLFRVSKTNGTIKHFTQQKTLGGISSNELTDVMLDQSGLVWLFHFNGSVDIYDNTKESFGFNQLHNNSDCLPAKTYYDFLDTTNNYWLLSQSAVTKINKSSGQCSHFTQLSASNTDALINRTPLSLTQDKQGLIWIGSTDGILKIDAENQMSLSVSGHRNINHIAPVDNQHLLTTTDSGPFLFNKNTNKIQPLGTADQYKNVRFSDVLKTPTDQYFFASNNGVLYTDNVGAVPLTKAMPDLSMGIVNSIILDRHKHFWAGTEDQGIFVFNQSFQLLAHIQLPKLDGSVIPAYSLLADDYNSIWVSTNNGLLQYNDQFELVHQYSTSNGLQGLRFNLGASHKAKDGMIMFGGRNGYNAFYPDQLKLFEHAPKMAISRLSRFNQTVIPNQHNNDFLIEQEINQLKQLTLTHLDYVIGFEFSALSYANPRDNQYQYKLEGFDPNWNAVDADNRIATYTNLPSGQFTFKVKGSNHNNNWSIEPKTLSITVLPPPWLTWWAISSYVILTLLAIYWYIQRKIKTNQMIAERLRIEVAEKTKELNIQKQTVESLLVKKNELFSNVSHEFRTPLTLILGPIKELLVKQQQPQDIKSLKMINRNANRLLSLVEQLLQIARVSNFNTIKTAPQKTQNQLQSLVESFQHMAKNKRIDLQLVNNDQSTIDVTDQFIDAVMGNLISNAIKYTPSGGSVDVSAQTSNDTLVLTVKDTGSGLSPDEQNDIFKRFKRLDSHQSIDGIGIGLSVVEEVVKVNQCEIKVNSELGVGSEFTVWVPLSDVIEVDDNQSISSLITQLQAESLEPIPQPQSSNTISEDNNLNTVLVIEDNHDMRNHIVGIVEPHYNCLAAENGVKGVACAIEQIPDLIISDVMMPEMDGFKVARIIRSDQRTSHIPFILLTALNDKVNRIKGWRENVDAYMTKPFDRDELLIQLENMLTIRDILKKKAGQEFSKGKSPTSSLPEKDQQFIDKLIETIQLKYQDPILNRAKLATEMAVSDRQLQRKVKALIDQNPMDMLREYRLNKAKELLKKGYQVSQVGDNCGFNSISYFSQCFKAQFGMSPKKYQQTE